MRNRACVWEGEVFQVEAPKTFPSGFTIREIVGIDDPDAKFKEYPVFTFKKDDISMLDGIERGDKVRIGFEVGGRQWKRKDGGTQFSPSLIGKKIEIVEKAKSAVAVPEAATPPADMGGDDEDMPF